ncbi:hypothetical protein O181_023040 [Austropuccinia psidii MF-1]|uniref:Uncharacterized protein n=1 Tax=Austropuccinia psidii MF-1 TaxID=1389203 RepID=A0A9Q3GYP6_9BASI|nr:hypothetical protein [Austropuccinia psidii MF-1]
MPGQHSPPARQKRSQARTKALLTLTPRFPQMRDQLDRGPHLEGAALTTFKGPGKDGQEDEKNSVEEEDSDGTEGVPAPLGEFQGTGGPTLAQSNQPVTNHSEPSLLDIMHQMTQIMANLQEVSSSEA